MNNSVLAQKCSNLGLAEVFLQSARAMKSDTLNATAKPLQERFRIVSTFQTDTNFTRINTKRTLNHRNQKKLMPTRRDKDAKNPLSFSLRFLPRSASYILYGCGAERVSASLRECFFLLTLILFPLRSIIAQPYQTLGPNSCGTSQNNCHVKENTWWVNDDHYSTADPFFDATGKYAKIAKLYGLSTVDIAKGNQKCMECHGTVISASATREVEFGVSCENCHGAGSGYKDIHSEKGGYPKALKLGLLEMKNLDTRAKTCVRCHLITEPKLVSAGHPTGEEFDYVRGIRQKIAKHWKHPAESAGELQPVFEKAVQARSPVQQITKVERTEKVVEEKPLASQATMPMAEETRMVAQPAAPRQREEMNRAMQPMALEMPPQDLAPTSTAPLMLPPFPAIKDSMSTQQILLLIKKRLDLLYQMTEGR